MTEGDTGMKDNKLGEHKVQEESGTQPCANERETNREQALA